MALPPVRLAARLGWRLRVDRQSPIPRAPVIVTANHASHLDPPFVGVAVGRTLRFLAVEGLWDEHRWLRLVLTLSGSIPLARERAPLGAMRAALSHLRAGGAICIFPEGGVTPRWGEAELHPSPAWLSLRSGAPILPVAVTGSAEAYGEGTGRVRRSRVRVVIGSPIDPQDFRGAGDASAAMMAAWTAWMDGILGSAGER